MGKGIKKKALLGVKWDILEQITAQFLSILVFVILARLLQPEDFGLVAMASAFIAFLGPFITQGFGAAIIQRETLEPEHLNTAFWANLIMGSVITMLGIGAAPLVAAAFDQAELRAVLSWLCINFVLLALSSVQQAIVLRDMNFRLLALRSIIAQSVAGIVGISMALLGYGVWSLVAQRLVQSLISLVLLWGISDWRPGIRVTWRHLKDLFGFGVSVMGNELLISVTRRSDKLLIGYFLGAGVLGFYTVAYRLLHMIYSLVSRSAEKVGMPAFARIQADPAKVVKAFYQMTQLTALIAFPTFFGVLVLVPELVPTLFGPQWAPSVPVMQVLCFIGVVHCLIRPMAAVIVGLGRPDWRFRLQMIDAAASLTGFFIAVHWGIVAVAFSFVLVGYLLAPLWFWTVTRLVDAKAKDYFAVLLVPLISTVVMVVVVYGVKYLLALVVSPLLQIVVVSAVGAGVYAIVVYWMSPQTAAKVVEIIQVFLPRKKMLQNKRQ